MKDRALKWGKLVLKFGLSFFIIGWMVWSGRLDLSVVKTGFVQGKVMLSVLALLVLALFIAMYRWRLLLKGQGIVFEFSGLMRYTLIGCFFNTTMPGAVSGDIIKAWYVISENKKFEKTPVLTAILLDRAMGVFGLVTVAFVPLMLRWSQAMENEQLHHVAMMILALAAGVAGFFGYVMLSMWGPFAALRRALEVLRKVPAGGTFLKGYDAFMTYRKCPEVLFQALLLSVFTHISVVTAVVFCAQALGETQLDFYQYFLLVPLGLITTAIPVAPAGLGVGHMAFKALFALAGSVHGAEVFTLYVTISILVNLSGVFFYLRSPKKVDELPSEESEMQTG